MTLALQDGVVTGRAAAKGEELEWVKFEFPDFASWEAFGGEEEWVTVEGAKNKRV